MDIPIHIGAAKSTQWTADLEQKICYLKASPRLEHPRLWGPRHSCNNMHEGLRSEQTSEPLYNRLLWLWTNLPSAKLAWDPRSPRRKYNYEYTYIYCTIDIHTYMYTQKSTVALRSLTIDPRLRTKYASWKLARDSSTQTCGVRGTHVILCTKACAPSQHSKINIWAERSIQSTPDFETNLSSAKLAWDPRSSRRKYVYEHSYIHVRVNMQNWYLSRVIYTVNLGLRSKSAISKTSMRH